MKNKLIILLWICFLLIPVKIYAQDYDIVDYNYVVSVSQNHTIDVEEQYGLYLYNLLSSSCLFERNLMYIQQGRQRNGETFSRNTRVKNISINSLNPIIYSKSDEKTIVAHPDTGEENYGVIHLKYQRDLGKVIRNENDELFFYIVDGTSSDMLSNIHFTIHLPTSVTEEDIRFYLNSNETAMVSYQIEGNTIIGNLNTSLGENQTLALSILFPKGYFIQNQFSFIFYFIILLFPILFLLFGISIWARFIRNNKVISTETMISPNQFDPAELSFLMNGITKRKDIVSIILVLANEGYLHIIHKDDIYAIKKVKSYDGKNALQKTMFDELFHESDIVNETQIREYLDTHEQGLKAIIDNPDHRKQIFEKKYKRIILFSRLFLLFGCIGVMGYSTYIVIGQFILSILLTICSYFGILFALMRKSRIFGKIMGVLVLFSSIGVGGYYLYPETLIWIIYIIGIILLCISASFFHKLPKRTRYGNEILGKITGFRTTLYYMSIPVLREQLEEDTTYFYRMLSYAYVFDFYDKWIISGYQIVSQLPSWYIDSKCGSLKTLRKSLYTFLVRLEISGEEFKENSH